MKALVLHGPLDLRWEERPLPEPQMGEALVRITAVGICGSDLHYYRHGRIGRFVVEKPLILGHECAGEVVEVAGPAAGNIKPGRRVALEPGIPCWSCPECRTGQYNLCRSVRFFATPPIDGVFCEYVAHPVNLLYPLPDQVGEEEGALLEPLSVAVQACRKAAVPPGGSALVSGAGPIGLVTMLVLIASGASRVFVTEPYSFRRRLAAKLGGYPLDPFSTEGDILDVINDLTKGRGVDAAIECAGNAAALAACLRATKPGGRVVVVGLGESIPQVPMQEVIDKELGVFGVFRYANTYEQALELVCSGRVDVKPLVTHRFPFADAIAAMQQAATGGEERMKTLILMPKY